MSEARKNLNKQIAEGSTTELMNLQKAKNETKEVRNTMSTE